jgi:PKD repeat protein
VTNAVRCYLSFVQIGFNFVDQLTQKDMDKHYSNTKWKAGLMSGLAILAGVFAQRAHAQLNNSNGNFTINSGAAASSTNFQNWRSFSQALQNISRSDAGPGFGGAGVSSPIVVNVMSDLTEAVPVLFPQISGTSLTNTITINGNGRTVTFQNTSTASNKSVIEFSGGDYFRIRNLVIQNTGTVCPWGIHFYNQSNHNLIENCTIQFTSWNTAITGHGTTATAYVVFSATVASTSTSTSVYSGQYDTIRSCLMRTTNTSLGPTFGITVLGSTSVYLTTPSNNTFEKNTIQNFYLYGINNRYTNGDRIIGNDISRVNAGTNLPVSTHMGIRLEYMYGYRASGSMAVSEFRPFQVSGNAVHDLPFTGSSNTNGAATPYGIYSIYCYGENVNNPGLIDNNNIYNLRSTTLHYAYYGIYNYRVNVLSNSIRACMSGSTSYSWGMYVYYHYDCRVDQNIIENNRPNSHYYAIAYWYNSGGSLSRNRVLNNILLSTSSTGYLYCFNIYYPINIVISGNTLIGNGSDGLSFVYSFNFWYPTNTQLESNLIAKQRIYYYHYGIYGYNASSYGGNNTIDNNTIDINYASPYSSTYHLTLYVGGYQTIGEWKIRGNIISQHGPCFYNYMCYLFGNLSSFAEFDYNIFFSNNTSTIIYYYALSGGTTGYWPGIVNGFSQAVNQGFAPIGATRNNNFLNPRFANIATNDYRPTSWRANNSMPQYATHDLNGNPRNPITCDRGCVENFTDLQATAVNWTAGTTPCSNFSERPTITIRNLFTDTAYNFNVSYRVNNGPKTTELVTTRILPGQSASYTFQTPVRLVPGAVSLQVFIDLPDDNKANDTQKFAMNVRPAPSGSELTLIEGDNDPRRNLEVTIHNQSIKYSFAPPSMYTNGQYGASNRWTATTFARSVTGRNVAGYVTMSTTPSSSGPGEITFTPTNINDEDSTFIVGVTFRDVQNGCDTSIQRSIFVQPLGRPNFTIPAVNCLGDATFFENNSTIKSGAMDYVWYFGDGDSSIASNPVHTYGAVGTYNVRLVTYTKPYGFMNDIVVPVTINPVPNVNFSKVNVCDGGSVTFTNTTTPLTPTTYEWSFGDNSARRTTTNASHSYANVGAYQVTLTATLSGCAKSITKNMYVFPKPVATYTKVSGDCENEVLNFRNGSTISSGLIGYYWDFDDNGAVGTNRDENHRFSTPGDHMVKMKAISEFGCVDSSTQRITVKPAPHASFTNTATCSVTPTTFTNTTAPVSGTNPSYNWNFGDGTTSTVMNPIKPWTTLGPKNITLRVNLDNGCSDEISRTMSVGIQPTADFTTNDVCAGSEMVFVNNTTWPQGDITYLWNFADGNTSNATAPRYTYQGVTSTRVFNVTLYAYIAGGCADSVTKQVIVNEGPRTCDFDAEINYNKGFRGVDFTPKSGTGVGAQPGVNYTWLYDREGQSSGPAGYNNFQEDGVYRITMRARNANGCECVAVKTVTINRRGVEDAQGLEALINVFPNPSNGKFRIVVGSGDQKDLTIGLYNLLGSKVSDIPTGGLNSGAFDVNAEDLSSGIYLVKITSGGQTAIRKVNIQR